MRPGGCSSPRDWAGEASCPHFTDEKTKALNQPMGSARCPTLLSGGPFRWSLGKAFWLGSQGERRCGPRLYVLRQTDVQASPF